MITKEIIESEFTKALEKATSIIPLKSWAHLPTGVELYESGTEFGSATTKGEVFINELFLGTTAINKLRSTLLHEFAHLTVGPNLNHNKVFKRVARYYGSTLDDSLRDEELQVINQVNYKWRVIAHMVDGTSKELGGVHRKTAKYSKYDPNDRYKSLSIERVKVQRFEFLPF